MIKRILSWGLILSLLLTLLPVSVAAEEILSEDEYWETAPCTCGAQPDAEGTVIHTEGCPLAEQEEPAGEAGGPVTGSGSPAAEPDSPAAETEEPAAETLTPPMLTCMPLDEETSSDMVLTASGEWDSYAWECCSYGFWSDWVGDDHALILSKEDFTAYGFRCTVTRGEQSVTSEVFAYDPSALERPMLMANGLSGGTLEEKSAYIRYYKSSRYHTRFDIQGVDGGTEFKTTYANGGYRTAISVDGGAKVEVPYQSAAASVGSSLTAQTTLEIVNSGRYVKVTYTVENNGSTTQNFQIGSSADVMIDNNDRAEVKGVFSGGRCTGLSMDGSPKNSYQFSLVALDCDTLWYGFYSKAYTNIFTDLEDKSQGYNGDSGMAWSWNGTVAPGQTWSRYVLIGAGQLPAAPSAPVLDGDQFTLYAGRTATIMGTATASGEQPAPSTVHVSIGGREYSAPVQSDGTFSVQIDVPADLPAGSGSFTYWGTTVEGGISEVKTQAVTMVTAPFISLTTGSVTVMEGDVVNLHSYIRDSNGNVTISPSTIDTGKLETTSVTYTARIEGYSDVAATLTVTVLPHPTELTETTVTEGGTDFTLSATMKYTGSLTYEETGFVYGALQNPTLTLNDGKVSTASPVNSKNGPLSAAISKDSLVYGVTYYARAYAKTDDGTVYYGGQSEGFGVGNPSYGTFSVTNSGNTFTITRSNGTDGVQTVYYRTVNGSAIGGTHFEHAYGTLTFSDGSSTSQTVTVTENPVTSTYGGSAATAYSNADRTYSLEIYRVTGGAGIDSNQKSATRNMGKDKTVDRSLYTGVSHDGTNGPTLRGDYKDDGLGWTNGTIGTAAMETLNISQLSARDYLLNTADSLYYWVTFTAWEEDSGYQAIQIIAGNTLDTNIYPEDHDLKGTLTTAQYVALFEHRGSGASTTASDYSFPTASLTGSTLTHDQYAAGQSGTSIRFALDTSQITVGFGASGDNSDNWYTQDIVHHFKFSDTREPQLLGVAPMAGGSYLPGDEVTVALVFDEIVDSANSSLNNVSIETNWGTFAYTGGADTNVLYFTGTVTGTAGGALMVESINGVEYIKDMANDTGTATGSTVNQTTDAALGNGPGAPTVSVSGITNANGTLTATITATNAGKLEYAWSTEADEKNVVSWKLLANTGGDTVTTRQTSGTWYLHARATNNDGVSAYASQSVNLGAEGSGTVQLPSLTVSADNTNWAKTRDITVTRSPADAAVEVTLPDGSKVEHAGSTYTATQNDVYTFTLTSGSDTITQTVTVSKLDTTAPVLEITDLSSLTHTEPVTLTVRVSDGESGVGSVKGMWNGGGEFDLTPTGETGAYTAISPDQSGDWTLTVTATDRVGNLKQEHSQAYRVDLSKPTVTVTRGSETNTGVTYSYTITPGGSAIVSVQLPDGCQLPDGVALPINDQIQGTVTLTSPGTYNIIVTDEAGHVVVSDDMTVAETVDGTAPDVRLSTSTDDWTQDPVTVTVSVYDEGITGSSLSATLTGAQRGSMTLSEAGDASGQYSGTFSAAANGTYTVTCTDAAGNTGSGTIEITNIDITAPDIAVSGNPTDWTASDVTITLAVTDELSGVNRVDVKKGGESVPVSANNGIYTFTVSENGTYTVTAADKAGNTSSETVEINRIDKGTPTLTVTGGDKSAQQLTLNVTGTHTGGSGVSVTVQKDGGDIGAVENGSYTVTSAGTYIFTAATGTGNTAVQTVTVHSITFLNGGTPDQSHLVVSGGTVSKPADPARDGYTFDGWYQEDQEWSFDAPVTDTLTLTARWTLAAPAVELTASPDHASGTYNGGNPVVTLTAVPSHQADHVTYTYQWYKDNVPMGGQPGKILSLTDVAHNGRYHVVVTASADGQSAAAASDAVTVTISKADPVVSAWPTASAITYGDSLGKSALSGGSADIPGSFAWKDSSITPNSGSQYYSVVFTPDDSDNYNTAEQVVAVAVAKKTLIPAVAFVADKEYDGSKSTTGTVTLTGGVLGQNPTAAGIFAFDNANAGQDKTVTVAVTLDGTWGENYVLATQELTAAAAITPKTVGLQWQGHENLFYTGQPVSVTAQATGLVPGDTCAVIVDGGEKVNVGTYTATATGLDNPNYQLPAHGVTQEYTISQAPGAASVTMASWTYGGTASAPVPASATHGTGSVTYHYTGRDGTTYDSADIPTEAGTYTVTATFAAVDNYAEITAAADFTIAPKPVFATWSALTHVYDGLQKAAGVTLSGVLRTDVCTISVSGYQQEGKPVSAPVDAGTYLAAAVLGGIDTHNYTLQNRTAALTIQPKQVIFTVADNTVQADGSTKGAAITADDKNCAYMVTYWKDGGEVFSPKDAGSYEIWVKITNSNYRHTDGSAEMRVGTLTITQAPPVVYTASFAGGEDAEGTAPDAQTAPADGRITLPANPFEKDRYRFIGWKADGDSKLCQPGDSFIMPARNVTFTAQWQAVFEVSGIITEESVTGTPPPAENAVVSLWLGANKIDETTTGTNGTYSFPNLIPGIYNLVVTKDVRTVTSKVEITVESKTCNATLPKGATNSIVEVTPGSPDIVVGNLDTVFKEPGDEVYTQGDQATVSEGGKVEITFIAEEKTDTHPEEQVSKDLEKIEKISGSSTLGLVMDYKLEKTVTDANGTADQPTLITQSNVLLEVLLPLPMELQGKDNYSVYRVHDGQAQELNQGETNKNALGEYFTVSSNQTGLTLYVKCFSTYVIGYSDAPVTPAPPDDSSSGSGGGSSAPVYPPKVEQPEHGTVTTSPKSPQKGDKVTITPTPEEGYAVDEVIITGPTGEPVEVTPNDDGTYTFTQPAGKVTITVTFRQINEISECPRDESCPIAPFTDADCSAWYHDGVHYCVEKGLMMGTSEATFAPNAATTRGMIVTILWRLEGSPIVSDPMDYDDVKPEDWCGEAVRWADSAGVVTGYGNGKFGPNDPITREQMAAMLWRYVGSPDVEGSLSSFADGAQTNQWAQSAMIWAVEQGLIVGVDDHQLAPRGQATRAQAATILMRFAAHMVQ